VINKVKLKISLWAK